MTLSIKPVFKHECKSSKFLSIFDPSSFHHPYRVGFTFAPNHDEDWSTWFPKCRVIPIALLPGCLICIVKMRQTLGKPLFLWQFQDLMLCIIWWSYHAFLPSWSTTKEPWNNGRPFVNEKTEQKDIHNMNIHCDKFLKHWKYGQVYVYCVVWLQATVLLDVDKIYIGQIWLLDNFKLKISW